MTKEKDMPGEWWTAPAESDDGKLIMITGRDDVDKFRANPRFSIRMEIGWPYQGDASGMPTAADSELMNEAQERLVECFRKDPVAVLTGVFTGDNRRDWVFYTLSTHIFCRKLNEELADMPVLPLELQAYNDPEWEAYDEMMQAKV